MARDYFREQVAAEEAEELVARLGQTLAESHAARRARMAMGDDEKTAWSMIARRVRRLGRAGGDAGDVEETEETADGES
jgi:hypothetical protein